MKGIGVTPGQAENIMVGLMGSVIRPDAAEIGAPLAIVAIESEDKFGFTGKAVCLVRIKDVVVVDRTRFGWRIEPFYVFENPPACSGLKSGIFDWAIPDEWMKKAAEEAGMPEMYDLWKAVQNGESK